MARLFHLIKGSIIELYEIQKLIQAIERVLNTPKGEIILDFVPKLKTCIHMKATLPFSKLHRLNALGSLCHHVEVITHKSSYLLIKKHT